MIFFSFLSNSGFGVFLVHPPMAMDAAQFPKVTAVWLGQFVAFNGQTLENFQLPPSLGCTL